VSRPYITLWSQPQVEVARRAAAAQEFLDHTANNQFHRVGVTRGDRVYVVATAAGQLLLLGRLVVDELIDQPEAERRFGPNVYEATDHLVGSGSPLRLDRYVPEALARQITRESGKSIGIAPDEYRVDANALRATGQVTEGSADIMDALIDDVILFEPDDATYEEGTRSERVHWRVERSPAVRAKAIALHGTDCMVCGFAFGAAYGALGDGYAEVHHLQRLGDTGTVRVDPATDVAVLCANCHRIAHRRTPPYTLKEIAAAMV
jgi:hypothetical protein